MSVLSFFVSIYFSLCVSIYFSIEDNLSVGLVYLGTTVWIDGVVGESDLVALPRGIHHVLVIQVEQETAHVLVVNLKQ